MSKRWSTLASFYFTACKHITNAHARSTGKTAIATGANCAPARSNDFERSIRRGPTCACKRNKGTHVRNSEHAPHINYVCKRQRTTCNLPTHRRRDADSAICTNGAELACSRAVSAALAPCLMLRRPPSATSEDSAHASRRDAKCAVTNLGRLHLRSPRQRCQPVHFNLLLHGSR